MGKQITSIANEYLSIIRIFPMRDSKNRHNTYFVFDFIDDPIITYPNSPAILLSNQLS